MGNNQQRPISRTSFSQLKWPDGIGQFEDMQPSQTPSQLLRVVALLWALPIPQTVLAVRLDQELISSKFLVLMNHKDCHSKYEDGS